MVVAVAALVGLMWQWQVMWQWLQSGYRFFPFDMAERLLTELRLQPRYLLLLLVPDARFLTLDAEVEISRDLLSPPSTAAALALVVMVLSLAIGMRRRNPLLSFTIFWFFATQALEASIVALEPYYEHRMYIPSALIYLGISASFADWTWRNPSRARRIGVAVASLLAVGAEAWGTVSRNALWAEPVAFWADAAAKSPLRQRIYLNLGEALTVVGAYPEAEEALTTALSLGGEGKARGLLSLAAVAHRRGDLGLSLRYLAQALEESKNDQTGETTRLARRALAGTAFEQGNLVEMQTQLTALLARWPEDGEGWNLQGALHLKEGHLDRAEEALRKARRYAPASAKVWNNVGALAYQKGDRAAAQAAFKKASVLDPNEPVYRKNLAQAEAAPATSPSSRSAR
jgi:tetratricopeptide (TPR) repeat protein